jgi:hypothetical protein
MLTIVDPGVEQHTRNKRLTRKKSLSQAACAAAILRLRSRAHTARLVRRVSFQGQSPSVGCGARNNASPRRNMIEVYQSVL